MNRPQKTHTAFWILLASGIISHLLAFGREIIIANKFGASRAVDTFLIALIPVSLFIMVSDSFVVSFVPLFTKNLTLQGERNAWKSASNIINIFSAFFILLGVIYFLLASGLARAISAGLDKNSIREVIGLSRILVPTILVIVPISLSTAILNSYRHFTYPAVLDLLPNIGIIIGAIALSQRIGVAALAVGILSGHIIRFFVQSAVLIAKLKSYYKFSFDIFDPAVKQFASFVLFTIASNGCFIINLIIDRYFGGFLAAGTIASLNFADKIIAASFYIISFAIGSAVFPDFSQKASLTDKKDFIAILRKTVRLGIVVIMPISIMLGILREPVISLLFKRGLFDAKAALVTSECLLFYSIGLFAHAGAFILVRAWYAMHKYSIPALTALGAIIVHIIANIFLVGRYEHKGLAMATSLSAIANFVFLFVLLNKKILFYKTKEFMEFFIKLLAVSSAAGLAVWLYGQWFLRGLNLELFFDKIIFLAHEGLVGVVSFIIFGLVFKLEEVHLLRGFIVIKLQQLKVNLAGLTN